MLEVVFTYPSPEGTKEVRIENGRTTLGRGDVDHRFDDEGLSRLHASVYRDGDRIWIVDENSSNGTSVNGDQVSGSGTPLRNGDSIQIGNRTALHVRISEAAVTSSPVEQPAAARQETIAVASSSPVSILPVLLIAFALLIGSVSAVLIGFKLFGSNRSVSTSNLDDIDDPDVEPTKKASKDVRPSPEPSRTTASSNTELPSTNLPLPTATATPSNIPVGKKYLEMTELEKRRFIADRSMQIAQVIGNRSSDQIPDAAVDKIKTFTDAYAKRINVKPLGGCRFGDNLQATYERASKNAPFIVRAFNEKGIDPRIGLYLAMIESEHCVCLQSPTGPLGMFQFTKATGELHGLKTVKGASPTNPDERCEPEPSARAAASYMKALTGRYGTGPSSVPLAIGSYNSGEGGLSSNLVKALESNSGLPRDFWTLISKGDILSKQFQSENFKYVPKFFAAAIVGENPEYFGLKLQPISTYSK